jgi:3-methyladenine DNA glycosylase AlkC
MAKALKDQINIGFLSPIVTFIKAIDTNFDDQKFIKLTFDEQWKTLELKQRFRKISTGFYKTLPGNYQKQVAVLTRASMNFTGFETLFFPDFIEAYGWQDETNFSSSMLAIEKMTTGSSAEFAIRPFIEKYPQQTFQQLQQWATSDNEHLRRLASEGSRPKLPWANQLTELIRNPAPNIIILELLKKDPSKYVQKSVANHLNDISKDHPDLILEIASSWQDNNPNTNWIIKHACRTLLKQALPKALAVFGYNNVDSIEVKDLNASKNVKMGESLNFSFSISANQPLGKIRIEYAIYFMKNNGKQSQKIFKISEANYSQRHKNVTKKYSFKPITTRKYYPGKHKITVLINGQEKAATEFNLTKRRNPNE